MTLDLGASTMTLDLGSQHGANPFTSRLAVAVSGGRDSSSLRKALSHTSISWYD
jgi:tRNA(Ile)-lysidine synthase TilS/MesJ